jgi:hypothetical protein
MGDHLAHAWRPAGHAHRRSLRERVGPGTASRPRGRAWLDVSPTCGCLGRPRPRTDSQNRLARGQRRVRDPQADVSPQPCHLDPAPPSSGGKSPGTFDCRSITASLWIPMSDIQKHQNVFVFLGPFGRFDSVSFSVFLAAASVAYSRLSDTGSKDSPSSFRTPRSLPAFSVAESYS